MAITLSGTDGITSPSFVPSSTTAPIVGQYLPAANTIGFVTAGTEKLRIDSSGALGIGTTSPSQIIHAVGGTPVIQAESNSASGCSIFQAKASDGSAFAFRLNGPSAATNPSTGQIYTTTSIPIAFSISSVERMRLDSSGNFGIGTNSPGVYLHVKGTNVGNRGQLTLEGSDYCQFTFYSNNSTKTASCYQGHSNGDLAFYNNSASGAFIIGNTGTGALQLATTGSASVVLNNGQLKFPATQVASSDANTLDDYEEGTWSPYYSTVGGDYTGTTNFNAGGTYVKIGKKVTVLGVCATSGAISGGSGQTIIKGLPFSVANMGTGSIWVNPDSAIYASPTALPTVIQGISTYISLSKSGTTNNPVFTELLKSGGNANQMYFTLTYFTT